ncbi:3-phosphoshikimate 1-carboxyvinyltransferase [Alicyclobacillus tolerans]|uniref:3-phosphoshikimate 1-carboxyvinyltransferase n=1 Tax=Alicyclobacillus tolerans TaxID=90970 RepID=UPI001EFF7D54|nr:3-phosphoshikimate 1-carboxyvinyltransferase [Alicyclobacillus tolerans]MCF8563768.1 3-phosphoshikimate 1-carboxyvinyltransferase [Alicyclobacillus tolerans]
MTQVETAVLNRRFTPAPALKGTVDVPGDKSITHRAILFGLLSEGTTAVEGWLDAGDCRSSLQVAQALGAAVQVNSDKLSIVGTGGNLSEPSDVLDCGNSGTTTRMFLGALAAKVPFACVTGDASLRRRPMRRVIDPLRQMGAAITARSDNFAPFAVSGQPLHGIEYTLPVASAQVKSAVLVAGVLAKTGATVVIEPEPSRDHTENMLRAFGADIRVERTQNATRIAVSPNQVLKATHVKVPGDISSAAFILAAAALVPGSHVTVRGIGLNPTRAGFLEVLKRMGANISMSNVETVAGEAIGDVTVSYGPLQGTDIAPHEVPSLIDELPILAILGAYAAGTTTVSGAGELRVKETDRISAIVEGLTKVGVQASERLDGFEVLGTGGCVPGGSIDSHKDHRIAMSFAVCGLASETAVEVRDWDCVNISYPSFLQTFERLGVSVPSVSSTGE